MTDTKKRKIKDTYDGIALAFTFLAIATFLYFLPNYFKIQTATRAAAIIFGVIGVIGLGIELNKFKKIGFDNLGIGLALGVVWVTLFYFFPIWWVNIITLPILLFALFGIILGLVHISNNLIFNAAPIKERFFKRVPLIIGQVLGITLVILQILKILKII